MERASSGRPRPNDATDSRGEKRPEVEFEAEIRTAYVLSPARRGSGRRLGVPRTLREPSATTGAPNASAFGRTNGEGSKDHGDVERLFARGLRRGEARVGEGREMSRQRGSEPRRKRHEPQDRSALQDARAAPREKTGEGGIERRGRNEWSRWYGSPASQDAGVDLGVGRPSGRRETVEGRQEAKSRGSERETGRTHRMRERCGANAKERSERVSNPVGAVRGAFHEDGVGNGLTSRWAQERPTTCHSGRRRAKRLREETLVVQLSTARR